MKPATIVGLVFMLFGIVITAMPAYLLFHPPLQVMLILALFFTGLAVALLGAWIIPNSGAAGAFTQFTVALSNSSLPVVGGRRAGDQIGATTATVTVSSPPTPPALP